MVALIKPQSPDAPSPRSSPAPSPSRTGKRPSRSTDIRHADWTGRSRPGLEQREGRNAPLRGSRRRPAKRGERFQFRALIVRPRPGFNPRDWRERPQSFEIVHDMGTLPFRGLRDAWLFQQNKRALEAGDLGLWAICLPQRTDELTDAASA